MLERAFNSSRFLVLIIVAMSMLSAVMLYLSTVVVVWNLVLDLFTRPIGSADEGKRLAVGLLKVLDILLIALTFQIIAISLFRLFIKRDNAPKSNFIKVLRINDFHDLKVTLLHVTIVILAILFLEHAVEVGASLDTLYFGLAIAVVIAAIVYATKQMHDK